MAKFIEDLKTIAEAEKAQLKDDLKARAISNTHIAKGVSLFVLVVFIIYQGIFLYLDGYLDFRPSYLIPVLAVVLAGPVTEILLKKGYGDFIAQYTIFILHFMMYCLAFWLDCFTDPSLCQIYTPLIIAVGPVLFFQSIGTEFLINTIAFLLYLLAAYFKITPVGPEHDVIQAFIAYALSILTLVVISGLRYSMSQSSKKLDEETKAREKFEYAAEVAEALSYDFLNVYSLDLGNKTWRIIKRDGYITKGTENFTSEENTQFEKVIIDYINTRVHPDDRERLRKALSLEQINKELEDKDAYIDWYRIEDNTGEHYYQFRFVRVSSTNKVIVGFRCVDNTMRYEREQRVALKEALSSAKQASEAKTTFLNNISHDVKTPLNAIMGFSKHARSNIDEKQVVLDSLKHIDTSSNQLLSYMDNVLQTIQLQDSRDDFKRSKYSLLGLANELIDKVNTLAKEKNITITFDGSKVINDEVRVNKERFSSVIYSVLENAVLYTPNNGHVLFKIRQGSEVASSKIRYVFTIKDDGPGMSDEFLQHIFEPFSREKNTTQSGIGGVGLGLSIAKNILESTGGGIVVNSKPNEGTEVIMVAMLYTDDVSDDSDNVLIDENLSHLNNGLAFKDIRVLIVDDNMINREVASNLLTEKGFICETAASGPEAITKIKESKPKYYSVILMDIMMPDMDGFDTTDKIRNLNRLDTKDMFIIALSANTNTIDSTKALAKGMNAFIGKPFKVEDFIGCLNKLYSKPQK